MVPASFWAVDRVVGMNHLDVLDASAFLDARECAIAVHASQTSPYEGLPDDLRRDFLTRDHLVRVGLG